MKTLLPFAVLSAIGLFVIWQAADGLRHWAIPVALLWLVVVSKAAAIALAFRDSRTGD